MRLSLDPIMIVLLTAALAAILLPARGLLGEAMAVIVPAAIMMLFFLHGLRLPGRAIVNAVKDLRLQLTILGCSFVLYPCLGVFAGEIAQALNLSAGLALGFVFLTLVPTTVSTSVSHVGLARGNVAAAVTASSLSSLVGTAMTPMLVFLLLGLEVEAGGASQAQFWDRAEKIVYLLLGPFIIGHIMRRWLACWSDAHKHRLVVIDRLVVGLLIYAAISTAIIDAFWQRSGAAELALTALLCGGLLVLAAFLVFFIGRFGRFAPADRITIFYCGGQKTMIAGIPMAQILLPAELVGEAILPMILFHQLELILGSAMVAKFSKLIDKSLSGV